MTDEAVAALAAALEANHAELPRPAGLVSTTPMHVAENIWRHLRADPAAARAVRDALDPDGLREALGDLAEKAHEATQFALVDGHHFPALEVSIERARLLEGTPDAEYHKVPDKTPTVSLEPRLVNQHMARSLCGGCRQWDLVDAALAASDERHWQTARGGWDRLDQALSDIAPAYHDLAHPGVAWSECPANVCVEARAALAASDEAARP